LPLLVAAVYLAGRSAPDLRASLSFVAGMGAILLILAAIHDFSPSWLSPGVAFSATALASFAAAKRAERCRPS